MEKLFQGNVKFPQGDGEVFPVKGSSSSVVEHFNTHLNPLLMISSSLSCGCAGSQAGSSLCFGRIQFHSKNIRIKLAVGNMSPIGEAVSTEAVAVNTQLSNLSADPPKDVQFFGNEVAGTQTSLHCLPY